ncbi:MAG: metal-dependent hydrolase [Planctomycetota bacterium]
MNPVTHFLNSWLVANAAGSNRSDRAIITVAGIAPDIDGIGLIADFLARNPQPNAYYYYQSYHHILAHNLAFGLLVTGLGFLISKRSWKTALMVFAIFHIHLLCDLIGSRGPEGYPWPIPYLWPFSDWQLSWIGQWALNAWPNVLITAITLGITLILAVKRGFSPLEMLSGPADKILVNTLRNSKLIKRKEIINK